MSDGMNHDRVNHYGNEPREPDYEHDPATCEVCQALDEDVLNALKRTHAPAPMNRVGSAYSGWVCVKCGRSYAPHERECAKCNAEVQL